MALKISNPNNEILKSLSESEIFSGLSETDLFSFSKISVVRKFEAGEMIFSEGDKAAGFYIVKSGKVKVFKIAATGKTQVIHIFGPGNPFGEAAIFMENRFPAYAEAVSVTELIYIGFDKFTEFLKIEPRFALNIIAALCIRLKGFLKKIEELSLSEVPSRLARFIVNLAYETLDLPEKQCAVTLNIKKSLLASQLGTVPETLSRAFAKLKSQKLIETEGQKILIMDFEKLEEMAEL
ncbi:MAG: Crp/Fnr family transcriptional regulator [Candidatus Wallbacteria bacterium]